MNHGNEDRPFSLSVLKKTLIEKFDFNIAKNLQEEEDDYIMEGNRRRSMIARYDKTFAKTLVEQEKKVLEKEKKNQIEEDAKYAALIHSAQKKRRKPTPKRRHVAKTVSAPPLAPPNHEMASSIPEVQDESYEDLLMTDTDNGIVYEYKDYDETGSGTTSEEEYMDPIESMKQPENDNFDFLNDPDPLMNYRSKISKKSSIDMKKKRRNTHI